VICRARLGSKAKAWDQLEQAQASKRREPSLGSRLRLGSALGRGLKRERNNRVMVLMDIIEAILSVARNRGLRSTGMISSTVFDEASHNAPMPS
jgi:hypothetical protein